MACTSCANGFIAFKGRCETDCGMRKYLHNKKCLAVSPLCGDDFNKFTGACKSCNVNSKKLVLGACVDLNMEVINSDGCK